MKLTLFLLISLPLAAASVRIYQTNAAGDNVHVIDPATNKVVMTVKGIEVPHGVVASPDGTRAYISCESENTLWAVDAATGKLIAKAPLTGHPNNVSISNDGKHVFVAIRHAPGAVDVILFVVEQRRSGDERFAAEEREAQANQQRQRQGQAKCVPRVSHRLPVPHFMRWRFGEAKLPRTSPFWPRLG